MAQLPKISKKTKKKILAWSELVLALSIIMSTTVITGGVFVTITYFSVVDDHANWRSAAAVAKSVDWDLALDKIKNLAPKASAYQTTINQCRPLVDINQPLTVNYPQSHE
jgi:hypothetical protein